LAKLFLFDPDLREHAALVSKIWGIGASDQQSARKLKDFAAAIHKHKQLEEAVFFYHGIPGGIMFDGKVFNLSDKELKDTLTAKQTTIHTIRFEGCWVGERPDEMAQFGSYFKASEMAGFTWEGVHSTLTLSVPKGADAATVRNSMRHTERWLAPGSAGPDALARKATGGAVAEKLLLEWYENAVSDPIKPPYAAEKGQTRTNFERLGSKQYKRRVDAGKRSIKAKELEEVSLDPISIFEYVTVTA
jgi:hypothetical protein